MQSKTRRSEDRRRGGVRHQGVPSEEGCEGSVGNHAAIWTVRPPSALRDELREELRDVKPVHRHVVGDVFREERATSPTLRGRAGGSDTDIS
jgi:hypothetical protein